MRGAVAGRFDVKCAGRHIPLAASLVFTVADGEAGLLAARGLADDAPHGGAQRGVERSVHSAVDGVNNEGNGCRQRGGQTGRNGEGNEGVEAGRSFGNSPPISP